MKRGKLIVIEGNDGSGKATQATLLYEYLQTKKIAVKTIDFPRYTASFFGKFIARFLQGEFGKLEEINPYLISIVYAQDREEAKEEMEQWLSEGAIVIANRYVPSNLAHQSGRLPKEKRAEFVKWDSELEYKINKIPQEDLTIYLHVPFVVSQKLLATKGKKEDMVEKDTAYLQNSEDAYNGLAKQFSHWETIECVDNKRNMRSIDAIHSDIKKLLAKKRIVQ
jgi:dTMP kinase